MRFVLETKARVECMIMITDREPRYQHAHMQIHYINVQCINILYCIEIVCCA